MIAIKSTIYRCIFYTLMGCLLPMISLYSQKKENMDDVFRKAVNEIYSNPDKVIIIGKKIITNREKTLKIGLELMC